MQNRNCRVKVCIAGNYKLIHTLDKKILQLYNKYMGKSVNLRVEWINFYWTAKDSVNNSAYQSLL